MRAVREVDGARRELGVLDFGFTTRAPSCAANFVADLVRARVPAADFVTREAADFVRRFAGCSSFSTGSSCTGVSGS